MKKTVLLLGSFVALLANGQERTVSSGGDISGSTGSVSFTVGLPDYSNYSGASGSITEGVQQPFELFALGVEDWNTSIECSVFPNPTAANLTISFPKEMSGMTYTLYDGAGRLVLGGELLHASNVIELDQLAMANYHLTILQNNAVLRTYEIIKHN